jgi:signal transduction histidine kinase
MSFRWRRRRRASLSYVTAGPVLDSARLQRLIEVGRDLLAELDLPTVLDRLLNVAHEVTGARYAALGILDERRCELERFLTTGIDEVTHRTIGELPRGRGVLSVLIEDPRPLRLHDIGEHPRSYGLPPGHPPMRTFLGVPILIRGEAWGNLYLTEKADGADFDEADEAALIVLADWAAIAIEHARLYGTVDSRRNELERAVRGFQATAAIAQAVGGETDLHRVLELIVKRGRALVEARSVLILLREGDELHVAAGAGQVPPTADARVPIVGSSSGEALERQRPLRVADIERELRIGPEHLGVPDASAALLVPLVYRGRALGVLIAFDRLRGTAAFTADDEQALLAFASSAATAVATAQTVEGERLRHSLRAAEEERRRWARELHDETLQSLAALQLLLAGAGRSRDLDGVHAAIREAVDLVTHEIANLRAIITDLRPATLDELGLAAALEGLVQHHATIHGLEVSATVELGDRRLAPELETIVYRLAQEALTNVAKHARARHVEVGVWHKDGELRVVVRDDGIGFDPQRPTEGFGLVGMRERVALVGGTLGVRPGERGAEVRATLPLAYAPDGVTSR